MKYFLIFLGISAGLVSYWSESPKFLEQSIPIKIKKQVMVHVKLDRNKQTRETIKQEIQQKSNTSSFQSSVNRRSFGAAFAAGMGGPSLIEGEFNINRLSTAENIEVFKSVRIISKTNPEYPPEAKDKGLNGDVLLKILVEQDGSIGNLKIESSNPPGVFDRVVLNAVRAWTFEPAIQNGKPVASWIKQKIKFAME